MEHPLQPGATSLPLILPLSEGAVRELHVGDFVLLSGRICTARDAVHRYLVQGGEAPCELHGGVIYHCGPVVVPVGAGWRILAAGPTTSTREEPYMAELISRYGLRGVIGKGGMGPRTLAACREHGAVYFHAVGGAAQVLASRVTEVVGVHLLERFGAPEAIWELAVDAFPAMVTMDSHGRSLHEDVLACSRAELLALTAPEPQRAAQSAKTNSL